MLSSWKVNNYKAEVADMKKALLHGDFKEESFLTIPELYKVFLQEIVE
jgi:predicted lipid-binding transport protein (Tim44 family)